ncbi:MAG TPA: hypothetical protein PKA06_15595, partial [Gemmatales bacterium]|nr:hypothetical protein [Gemmatales bacterium]
MNSLDLSKLKVYPLSERQHLTRAEEILIEPATQPASVSAHVESTVDLAAEAILRAKKHQSAILLIYGAHLLRNGAARIVDQMLAQGWISHLATNGAGSIHDWEYAWYGASTESVEMGVAHGKFGTWHETASTIHLALLAGALE